MTGQPPPPGKRAAISIGLGLLAMCLFVFFFVYPGHDPKPNGLPIAVAQGAQPPPVEGIDVVQAADEAEIRQLILDREVYGGIAPGRTLVSSAASFTVAQLLRGEG